MSDQPNEEPKIIVDDDWKEQVQREKEELKKQEAEQTTDSPKEPMELPPASFQVLVSTLATQAMSALGIFPDPVTGQPNHNPQMAKHFIDMLGVIQDKTKGNLEPDEENMLRESLHQLRMIFVSSDKPADPASKDSAPTIELP